MTFLVHNKNDLSQKFLNMGVRKGGGQRGLLTPLPPWPAKTSMFLDFFEKNSIFLLLFRQKLCYSPHLEKSADAHVLKTFETMGDSRLWATNVAKSRIFFNYVNTTLI